MRNTPAPKYRKRTDNGTTLPGGKSQRGDVRAKKHLGQHFLTDLRVAERIAATLPEAGALLEVGPGMGVLTQFLLDRPLTVCEIDPESVAYLRTHYPTLQIIEGDFLRLPLGNLFPDGVAVIGNFPYNISSQIFFHILDHRDHVPAVAGMLQKEVAARIASPPGSKEYGILSVLLQAYYDIEYLFEVPPEVFNPPPKVQSAVIRLRRNAVRQLDCNEALFKQIVKATFNQRRKTIRNSLRAAFPALTQTVEEHALYPLRPETLSVAQFVDLTEWVEARL